MAAHAETPVNATPVNAFLEPDPAIGLRYVARQPILDLLLCYEEALQWAEAALHFA